MRTVDRRWPAFWYIVRWIEDRCLVANEQGHVCRARRTLESCRTGLHRWASTHSVKPVWSSWLATARKICAGGERVAAAGDVHWLGLVEVCTGGGDEGFDWGDRRGVPHLRKPCWCAIGNRADCEHGGRKSASRLQRSCATDNLARSGRPTSATRPTRWQPTSTRQAVAATPPTGTPMARDAAGSDET